MLFKALNVVEELLAEVTPWMWKDLRSLLSSNVTFFDVLSEILYVIDTLFPYEYGSTLETNFAECLLVGLLKMSPKTLNVWEWLCNVAVVHQAL